jgi:hypothetical protein
MKNPILFLSFSALVLAGCASSKKPDVSYINPAPVAGNTVASNSTESVRTQDVIKAYPTGRYVDPNDANTMYGQGVAYQVQQNGGWNLNNNDPVHVPLGPVTEYTTPADSPNTTPPELEQKLREEDSVVKVVTSENDRLMQELDKLRLALTDAQTDKTKLADLQTQLKALQDEKAKDDAAAKAATQHAQQSPPPKKTWFGL